MKVKVDQQQEQIIIATIEELDRWWKQATSDIFNQQRLIHFVEIDGNILYDNYEQYLLLNVSQIQEVNIQTLSRLESIQDTEQSIDDYLERFIPAAQDVTDQLYGEMMQQQQNLFAQFIEGLGWIVKAFEFNQTLFNEDGIAPPYLSQVMEPLEAIITQIYDNVQQEDFVSVGDLIQYELIPLLQKFQNRKQKSELS
ncbi:hypothetical protein [Paenibacillus motobuensis]|uniref:Uncharacterized protein n=1 Tax=Paenibacillus motobuensis TaxID=295324 RepID=A0ABN0Y026_9BACL